MTRPFYSDYVRHALRFYTRNLKPLSFKSQSDMDNWKACHTALKDCSDRDRDILVTVYSSYDTLADSVYETAIEYGIDQNLIWDLMKDYERKIAKCRGLI